MNKLNFIYLGILIACSNFSIVQAISAETNPSRLIAHAFGGINTHTYTNSLEAFKQSYKLGFKYFEADLWLTKDSKVVLFHDGFQKQFKLKENFKMSDFLSIKIYNQYTPMGLKGLVDLFIKYPDWSLVTDVKNEQRTVLKLLCVALRNKGINCLKRIIPQFYNANEDFQIVKSQGFKKLIFTLYRTNISDQDLLSFLKKHNEIELVTMSVLRWNKKLVSDINQLGRKVFVHTVNDKSELEHLIENGIWGVYTDFLIP